MRLEIGFPRAHLCTLMEPLAPGKLLQTGDLGVSLTPHTIPTSISVRLLQECDGRLVATPLNFHLSFADRAAVNPAASRDCSDEELVRAAQSGDRNAFGRLYERFAG